METTEVIEQETKTVLSGWRKNIIEGILQNGLLPASEQGGLNSEDREHKPWVYGTKIMHPSGVHPAIFINLIPGALYWGGNSILPVIAERQGETFPYRIDPATQELIEKRIASSFLVVCRSADLEPFQKDESGEFVKDRVSSKDFSVLVFPLTFANELEGLFSTSTLGIGKPRIKIVEGVVTKKLIFTPPPTSPTFSLDGRVPDYESSLMDVLKELGGPIWVHGVRLPTKEDLAKSSKGLGGVAGK